MADYFAYGSNMNPARVRQRGLQVELVRGACLPGYRLVFDKHSAAHAGSGHANIEPARGEVVEGVVYRLAGVDEIRKMDRFENTPINYSREVVEVHTDAGPVTAWTYCANPAVRRAGLKPPRDYLLHLLEGRHFLSAAYVRKLELLECAGDP